VCAFFASEATRPAEQISALVGLQLTSIVGVRPTQLAAKAVTSSRLGSRGDGQENRRLSSFPFRFSGRPHVKRSVCAHECAQTRLADASCP
jgi:hypothetical protein